MNFVVPGYNLNFKCGMNFSRQRITPYDMQPGRHNVAPPQTTI